MDFDNNRAIYLQIADSICDSILTGELAPGQRIPSVREYSATMAVNVNTVMRAYEYLSTLCIIYNKRGLGFFTADDAREMVIHVRRAEILGDSIRSTFRQLMLLGISPSELSVMYSEYIKYQNQKQEQQK